MWELIIPLIVGYPEEPHDRTEHRVTFSTYEGCQAEREYLKARMDFTNVQALSHDPRFDQYPPFARPDEAARALDQPPGVDERWSYLRPAAVGYCQRKDE